MSAPTWSEIVTWTKREIETARTALETPAMSPEDTERLRARIAVMREIQGLENPPKPPDIPLTPSY